jgi:hypothetical protein
LEGRPVLNSSAEIETLLHTTALVLNRGMLVRYYDGNNNERPRGRDQTRPYGVWRSPHQLFWTPGER